MNLQELKSKLIKPDRVPEGWKTSAEWQKEWGLGQAAVSALLSKAIEAKLCKTKKFLVHRGAVGFRPTPFYKFTEGK
jgi:hypothetical protein